eukprot:scaffold300_cov144-Isochrysis_galbana.AAC.9
MDGRFLLLVLGFAPLSSLFAREKPRQLSSVIVLGVTFATYYVGSPSALRFYSPIRVVNQSINLSHVNLVIFIHILAIIHSAARQPHSHEFIQSIPSRQSGMVQPVVQEMFATVHAAGSSLLGL